jgi:hypothetical protein
MKAKAETMSAAAVHAWLAPSSCRRIGQLLGHVVARGGRIDGQFQVGERHHKPLDPSKGQ